MIRLCPATNLGKLVAIAVREMGAHFGKDGEEITLLVVFVLGGFHRHPEDELVDLPGGEIVQGHIGRFALLDDRIRNVNDLGLVRGERRHDLAIAPLRIVYDEAAVLLGPRAEDLVADGVSDGHEV